MKPVFHSDIWDSVFDQLAQLGYHGTLANCALLTRELSWLALRRLYRQQFLPSRSWGVDSTEQLWATLMLSAPGKEGSLTSHPYLTYVRHLDLLNYLSVFGVRDFPDPGFVARTIQHAGQQQQNTNANNQTPIALDQVTARSMRGPIDPMLLSNLARMTEDSDLRVMLKKLTADTWPNILAAVRSFGELESLSLVFIEGLDASAAGTAMACLPKLKDLLLVQADATKTPALADFIANLKPDQLRSFGCSLSQVQLPVLQALLRHRTLQELSLHFLVRPPLELHRLAELTNLTSLTLSFSFFPTRIAQTRFEEWAAAHRSAIANWLASCANLRSLHVFRMPDLVPAITDALDYLRLERLHIFSTGCHLELYRVLRKQRLEYLFLAECPGGGVVSPSTGWRDRGGFVMDAVAAMPGLRDLRLHTYSPLGWKELEHVASHVPKLETLSFVCRMGEDPTRTLRALASFRHLTNLKVLGLSVFSSRDVLRWIEWTQCHLRPGGFSLSLPSQDRRSWYGGLGVTDCQHYRDPPTERITEMLRFFSVWDRGHDGQGLVWRGNDYDFDEERMYVHVWDDIRGPAEALQLLRGTGPYSPFMGLMADRGNAIASNR
ncbi:hypothetical protein CCHL11_08097 [Colletotrichum chlorophyti]|uniref:F-box domain-containing protein n=1 Tax=Colletotrichum chlorophyti TaxID=708187 RepID=A0A1Q8RMD5_9PEZI|nr:hypothetical protein CCHL11_08097 [Colletotrichum chlorophyti]